MKPTLTFSVKNIIQSIPHAQFMNDELAIIEMKHSLVYTPGIEEDTTIRVNAFCVVLIYQGTICINIDTVDYQVKANNLLAFLDLHLLKNLTLSEDLRADYIVVSKNFMGELLHERSSVAASLLVPYVQCIHFSPIQMVEEKDMQHLKGIVDRIKQNIERREHKWYRDIIINDVRSLFMEVTNEFEKKNEKPNKVIGYKEHILVAFIQLMNQHCRQEHEVQFYADKLCIAADYLSRILKNMSGKTVNTWIDNALMREAKICLHHQELSLKEISEMLNFSDQSAFGKFFKKHSGMSPLQYRANISKI